jgi:hypothetical protein
VLVKHGLHVPSLQARERTGNVAFESTFLDFLTDSFRLGVLVCFHVLRFHV